VFSAQINVSALKTALNTVRAAISPRAANEINKCVRLEVGAAGLVITATSGLIAIEAHAECEAMGDEAIVVPHDKLAMVCGPIGPRLPGNRKARASPWLPMAQPGRAALQSPGMPAKTKTGMA